MQTNVQIHSQCRDRDSVKVYDPRTRTLKVGTAQGTGHLAASRSMVWDKSSRRLEKYRC